ALGMLEHTDGVRRPGGVDVDVGHGEVLAVETALQPGAGEGAGGAVAAVGTDDPAEACGLVPAAGAEGDLDSVSVLRECGERDAALDDDAELGGTFGQDGLGVRLGNVEDVGVAAGDGGGLEADPGRGRSDVQ